MLLAEQIVHGIFNDALHRLRIQHVRPLPIRADGNQRSSLLLQNQQRHAILNQIQEHTAGIVASLLVTPPLVLEQQKEEETPALERIPSIIKLEKKKSTTTTKKSKRPRDTSDTNRVNQSERGELCVPDDIALVLAERPNRFRPVPLPGPGPASDALSLAPEQQPQKQKQLPSKKYACVQYAPEFIEWLDRASLVIYRSPEISKAAPIFAANKEEFSLLMETSTIKMPADMRCTGCRRYFRIKTEEDNLVQKTMTHFTDSTRASHCIRCRVLDWTLSAYNDALHPCRVVIVPVMDSLAAAAASRSSPDSPGGGSDSAPSKKKRIRKKQKPETLNSQEKE